MSKKENRWDAVIRAQLKSGANTTDQILAGMEATGFQHASVMPRATLGARLAEMVKDGVLERVGRRAAAARVSGSVACADERGAFQSSPRNPPQSSRPLQSASLTLCRQHHR